MDDLVKRCVDLDQWQHSWHNDFKELEDYDKSRNGYLSAGVICYA